MPSKDLSPASEHPEVLDVEKVGTYPARVAAGGGFVWDEVLEYRVWCHPLASAHEPDAGSDYFRAFKSFGEAMDFSHATPGAEEPLALILQREHIDEPEAGQYRHVIGDRLTEWPVSFLRRPRRTPSTIPDFLAPTAPENRLDILRGLS